MSYSCCCRACAVPQVLAAWAIRHGTKKQPTTTRHCPASLPPPAVASRLQTALSTVLLHNDSLRDTLVGQLGFAVRVRPARRPRSLNCC